MKKYIRKYNEWLITFSKGWAIFIGLMLAFLSMVMFVNGTSMLLVLPAAYVAGNFVGRSTMDK